MPLPRLAIAAGIGAAWGVFCAWGDVQDSSFIEGLANTSGPWVLLAFACGYIARRPVAGFMTALMTLMASLVAYRLAQAAGLDDASATSLLATTAWIALIIVTAAVFGAAGALTRTGRGGLRRAAWLAPTAILMAEASLLLSLQGGIDRGALAYLSLELLVALALVAIALGGTERLADA